MEIKDFNQINEIANEISKDIQQGKYKTIGLIGDLGTGKTYFTKNILKNLGVKGNVKSPTFNYVNTYELEDFTISHFDVYRLNEEDELFEIGYEDYLDGRILIVEWADKILDLLPEDTLFVKFEYAGEDTRYIEIKGRSEKYE